MDINHCGYVMLSTSEQALRKRSGTVVPQQCWRCMNNSRHHDCRFHTLRDCPHKQDPQCQERAKGQIESWRKELAR